MKKWFLAKSLTDRIVAILIASIVVIGGVATTVVLLQPDKAATESATTVLEEQVTALADLPVAEEKPVEVVSEPEKEPEVVVEEAPAVEEEEEEVPFEKTGFDLVNGNFAHGIGGFEFYAASSDYADYSINEGHGIDITIDNTGDEDWHVQLKQNDVALENGKWYRLSLDAKSTLNRTITMTMQRNGMNDDDWTPYCAQERLALTGGWNHYEIVFKMDKNTDKRAVFNVSMGTVDGKKITKTHTVSLNNIKLEKLPDNYTDSLRVNGNLIGNGDFSSKSILWETVVAGDGRADVSFAGNKATFDIKNPGTLDWHVQLKQGGIRLNNYNGYKMTFNVYSSAARTIKVGIMDTNYVTWYGGADVYVEGGVVTPVTVEFYNDKGDNADAIVMISLGQIEGTNTPASVVTISDVALVADSSVHASQGGNGGGAAPSTSVEGWTLGAYNGGVALATSDAEKGISLNISNTGTDEWHVQLGKKPVALVKGYTYKISYEIESTIDRYIKYMIQRDGGDWATYVCDAVELKAGEKKNVENTFRMQGATDEAAVFNFSLGAIEVDGTKVAISDAHIVSIKNIKLELVSDEVFENPSENKDLPYAILEANAPFNNGTYENWNIDVDAVIEGGYEHLVGKSVFFSCIVKSDADFNGCITGLSGEDYSWNEPSEDQKFDIKGGSSRKISCVIPNFKKPMLQIWSRDMENPADIYATDIILREATAEEIAAAGKTPDADDNKDEEPTVTPVEPGESVYVFEKNASPKVDQDGTRWEYLITDDSLVGKKVKMTVELQSAMNYAGAIVIQSHADYSGWNPTEVKNNSNSDVMTWSVTAEDFKQAFIQIYWKDDSNLQDVYVRSIKLEVVGEEVEPSEPEVEPSEPEVEPSEPEVTPSEPEVTLPEGAIVLKADAEANNVGEGYANWDIDLSSVDYSAYVGKEVKFSAKLTSEKAFSGCITALTTENWSWNDPTDEQKYGSEGGSVEVSCTYDDFKKPVIQIYEKNADVVISDITFEVIETEVTEPEVTEPEVTEPEVIEPVIFTEDIYLPSAENFYINGEGKHQWEITIDPSKYSQLVGKKVKASAEVVSDSWFGGVIVIQSHENYSGWNPAQFDGAEVKDWTVTAEDFKQLMFQIYWRDESETASDILIKNLKLEVVE